MATDPDEYELLLDRAVRAVREVAVSSGPPAEVVEKVCLAGATAAARQADAIEQAQSAPDTSSLATVAVRRYGVKLMRPRNLATIAAAGFLIVLATQWLPIQHNGNFAFAQVQEQVGKTESVQYTETPYGLLFEGNPTVVAHVKILGNRVMRNEISLQVKDGKRDNSFSLGPWGPSIEITDLDKKKKAVLYPEIRGYMSMDWGGTFTNIYMPSPKEEKELEEMEAAARKELGTKGPATKVAGTYVAGGFDWDSAKPDAHLDIYELIRHVPTDRAKKLDEKTINGKRVVGFLVEEDEKQRKSTVKLRHTWWVDPTTKLPVQLEISFRSDDSEDSGSTKVVSDIVFDAPLDPALFSISVPAGYSDLGPAAKKAQQEGLAMAKNQYRMNTLQFIEVENLTSKNGRKAPELVKRVTILDNHLERDEVTIESADNPALPPPAGIVPHVSIQDAKQGKTIILFPEKKEYLDPAKTSFTADYVQRDEALKQKSKRSRDINAYAALGFTEAASTRLPLKSLDGQLVFGKHAREKLQRGKYVDSREWTMWLDPFMMQFVRCEAALRSDDPSVDDVNYVLRDFSYYAPVEKAMFSTDPPPGWTDLSKERAVNDEPSAAPGKSDE